MKKFNDTSPFKDKLKTKTTYNENDPFTILSVRSVAGNSHLSLKRQAHNLGETTRFLKIL